MADKHLYNNAGIITAREFTVVSTGVAEAGDGVALDGTGKLDVSVMPVGYTTSTKVCPAVENLSAGDFINMYLNVAALNCRKADATNGRRAHGFVLAAVVSPANATCYLENINTQLAGLTIGAQYYLSHTTPGGVVTVPSTTAGHLNQSLGVALAATEIHFEPGPAMVV